VLVGKRTFGSCDGFVGSDWIDFVFGAAKFIKIDRFLVTDFAIRANLLRPPITNRSFTIFYIKSYNNKKANKPFVSSVSIGCLSAVISVNVHRYSTTVSRSFVIGAICINTHIGVSIEINILIEINL
jgi:hypothetical protein